MSYTRTAPVQRVIVTRRTRWRRHEIERGGRTAAAAAAVTLIRARRVHCRHAGRRARELRPRDRPVCMPPRAFDSSQRPGKSARPRNVNESPAPPPSAVCSFLRFHCRKSRRSVGVFAEYSCKYLPHIIRIIIIITAVLYLYTAGTEKKKK